MLPFQNKTFRFLILGPGDVGNFKGFTVKFPVLMQQIRLPPLQADFLTLNGYSDR